MCRVSYASACHASERNLTPAFVGSVSGFVISPPSSPLQSHQIYLAPFMTSLPFREVIWLHAMSCDTIHCHSSNEKQKDGVKQGHSPSFPPTSNHPCILYFLPFILPCCPSQHPCLYLFFSICSFNNVYHPSIHTFVYCRESTNCSCW